MGKKVLAVTCIVAVSLAASATAYSPYQSDTPLYTVRMEQACSRMHFLPAAVNEITYTTTKGYTLDYHIPEMEGNDTDAHPIHWDSYGFSICHTCWLSCGGSCGYTCGYTCPYYTCC